MPDLLAHSLAVYVGAARVKTRRLVVLAMAGTVLPDVMTSGFLVGLPRIEEAFGIEIGARWISGALVFHALFPFALFCWAIALYLPGDRGARLQGGIALVLGGWLHIGLDLFQRHISPPAYFPAYPLIRRGWELGWIWTEDSIRAIPVLALIALGAMLWRRRLNGEGKSV